MRLESFKKRWSGQKIDRLHSEKSTLIESTDEDAKIRLDDPTLSLNLTDS